MTSVSHRLGPSTSLGRWALALALAGFVLMNFAWTLLGRLGGLPGLALALIGGVLALAAILRRGERSLAVYAALVPFLAVVAFVVAELVVGHE